MGFASKVNKAISGLVLLASYHDEKSNVKSKVDKLVLSITDSNDKKALPETVKKVLVYLVHQNFLPKLTD